MTDWRRSERFALIISLSSLQAGAPDCDGRKRGRASLASLPGHASKRGVRDLQLTRSSVTKLSNVARNAVFDWL